MVTYIDSEHIKQFSDEIKGRFALAAKGEGLSSDQVILLSRSEKTIAEFRSSGEVVDFTKSTLWKDFGEWLKTL